MIKVDYVEPSSPEWERWKRDAASSIAKAAADYKSGDTPPEVNDALGDAQKAEIRDAFHRKCAYCEAPITGAKPGDVRRYRPKSAVFDETGNRVMVRHENQEFPHPGYYWLGSEPRNLLYTCNGCSPTDEKKRDRFPVQGDDYKWVPGTEKDEFPLLFHPIHDKPEQHLWFDKLTGNLIGKDERAQVSIEVLELNREELKDARTDAFHQATRILERVANPKITNADELTSFTKAIEVLRATAKGRYPFSFVYRYAVDMYKSRLEPVRTLIESMT